jgi:hypothetical protein
VAHEVALACMRFFLRGFDFAGAPLPQVSVHRDFQPLLQSKETKKTAIGTKYVANSY